MDHTATKAAKNLLVDDFWRVVDDAEALLEASADDGRADLVELRSRVERSLANIRTRVDRTRSRVQVSGVHAANITHDYIRRNPWPVIGVAVGVGLLIGLFSTRR